MLCLTRGHNFQTSKKYKLINALLFIVDATGSHFDFTCWTQFQLYLFEYRFPDGVSWNQTEIKRRMFSKVA